MTKEARRDSSARQEEFEVRGEDVVKKVKELIKEGNVRKIKILDKKGEVIAEFPLTVGVVGTLLAAPLVAIGAIAALMTECTISVERK